MLRFLSVLLAWFAANGVLHAEILTKPIEYKHGTTNLEGLLVYESTGPAKRPGVLLATNRGRVPRRRGPRPFNSPSSVTSSSPSICMGRA